MRRTLGHSLRFVDLANDVNVLMPNYVVQRLSETLNRRQRSVSGSRVLLLGLAYKRNTGDCRESPAMRVAELLNREGAQVWAVDSHVDPAVVPSFIALAPLEAARVTAADLVVLLTDHDDVDYALLEAASVVFDTRGRLQHANVERL